MFYLILFCLLLGLVIVLAIVVKVITIGIKETVPDKQVETKPEMKHIDERA